MSLSMPEFSNNSISAFNVKREAAEQGGLLSGKDPSAFNPTDPFRLWTIQVALIVCATLLNHVCTGVIILTTQFLALGLGKIRQPKVIAEVIGGIILGPTALGRIPGFTEHIFPTPSRSYLSLVANIGLCLFLFLIGLEIDSAVIKRNARLSATVALAGMVLPFALGAALAVPLYNRFIEDNIAFTHFMLFTGVAYSITAFPVLCRILTSLQLLDTTVGIVVLSAGIGNDIIGWTLLALSVALVNAGSGLTALWILLLCVGWTLFLLFPVKRCFRWLAHHSGSVENGPTMLFMTVTILTVFGSAFFTDIIGVHAIFGAFLTGLVVPREGGLAIALTEKLEDMVSIIFLPLYFTLSGLSTDLGLLNDGITWGYTAAICVLAFVGKFGGCTIAAKFSGFNWRESGAIGSLMSCKGLVELIVLNVGLSAGILSQRVFSMFVLEALLLTFMTTPLVTVLYPPEFRVRVAATGANFNNVPGQDAANEKAESSNSRSSSSDEGWHRKTRFTVVLDKIDHLPGMMALTQLIQPPPAVDSGIKFAASSSRSSPHLGKTKARNCSVDALRLIELSDRTSAVMKSSVVDTLLHTDPLLGIFRMFGELNDLPVSSSLSIVKYDDLAYSVSEHARNNLSDLILVPWLPPSTSPTTEPQEAPITPKFSSHSNNPFDALFKTAAVEKSAPALHSHFVRGVFSQAKTDVALFVDRGYAPGEARAAGSMQRVFLPFFGGPDDRLALDFVVQLCANPKVSATVVRIVRRESTVILEEPEEAHLNDRAEASHVITIAATAFPDTVYGNATTETRLQSETADNVTWARYASHPEIDTTNLSLSSALSRMEFIDLATPVPLHALILQASSQLETLIEKRTRHLIVVGRSRRLAVEDHHQELKELMDDYGHVGSEVKKTIGDVATAFVVSGCKAGIVVLQSANISLD